MTVSVVVPIYNTEEYLRQCLDSIVGQSYFDLEIILIDDGSTDSSPSICDEYALRDKRVKVIHKKNEGVSIARNTGVDASAGEYLAFVDSDDVLDLQMFERLVNNAQKYNAEISVCDFGSVGGVAVRKSEETICMDSNRALKHLYLDKEICFVSFCGKTFKRELFANVTIPSVRCAEDNYVLYKLLLKAESITFDNRKMYFYRYRENSATKMFDAASAEDFRAFGEQMELWKALGRKDLHRMCFIRGFKRLFMTMDCASNARKSEDFEVAMKNAYDKFVNDNLEHVRIGFLEKRMHRTDWFDGKKHHIPFYYIRIKDYLRNFCFLRKYSLK